MLSLYNHELVMNPSLYSHESFRLEDTVIKSIWYLMFVLNKMLDKIKMIIFI